MPPTIGYSFGDVVLVPFPFTDQAGIKKRPAVIISGTAHNNAQRDVVIMAITSQVLFSNAIGDALVADWQAAGLIKPSAIKPVITTIEQSLVIRRLGQLTAADQQVLRNVIGKLVG
jgi:mRNA interferase MazF